LSRLSSKNHFESLTRQERRNIKEESLIRFTDLGWIPSKGGRGKKGHTLEETAKPKAARACWEGATFPGRGKNKAENTHLSGWQMG